MSTLINISSTQLRQAADLKEKIGALEQELAALLGGAPVAAATPPPPPAPVVEKPARKPRKISAAGIARIRAAQIARWARAKKGVSATPAVTKPKKFTMSDAAKAKIAAAARKRWAKVRAAKKA